MKRLSLLGSLLAVLALAGCERPGEFEEYDSSVPATNTITTPSEPAVPPAVPPATDLNRNAPPDGSQTPPPTTQPQPETQPDQQQPQTPPTPQQQPDRETQP